MSPAKYRQQIRLAAKNKYLNRVQQKAHASTANSGDGYKMTPLDDIFQGDPLKKAQEIESKEKEEKQTNGVKAKATRKRLPRKKK